MIRDLGAYALANLVIGLGLFGFSSAADAQQPVSPRRIGVLLVAISPEDTLPQQFRRGLVEAGYSEGRDVAIEWRSANGDFNQIPQLAADLVQSKVDVIVVETTPGAQAVKRATSTIPVVMTIVSDPVGSGLVASLAHPGGNITGLAGMVTDLTAKRLQLLKEAIPRLTRVAVLWNPDTPSHPKVIQELKAVAPSLAVELSFVELRTPEELSAAFSTVGQAHARALYVIDDAFFAKHRNRILELAAKGRLPVFGDRAFADAGALMSYGPNFGDLYHRAAGYVDKILKGAKPADLPQFPASGSLPRKRSRRMKQLCVTDRASSITSKARTSLSNGDDSQERMRVAVARYRLDKSQVDVVVAVNTPAARGPPGMVS